MVDEVQHIYTADPYCAPSHGLFVILLALGVRYALAPFSLSSFNLNVICIDWGKCSSNVKQKIHVCPKAIVEQIFFVAEIVL